MEDLRANGAPGRSTMPPRGENLHRPGQIVHRHAAQHAVDRGVDQLESRIDVEICTIRRMAIGFAFSSTRFPLSTISPAGALARCEIHGDIRSSTRRGR